LENENTTLKKQGSNVSSSSDNQNPYSGAYSNTMDNQGGTGGGANWMNFGNNRPLERPTTAS
jgi:hypothetical protein